MHLKVADTHLCSTRCATEFGNPCTNFCPANVYEMIDDGTGGKKLQINASNCVHCKACDIKEPYTGQITWVPPEGGSGSQLPEPVALPSDRGWAASQKRSPRVWRARLPRRCCPPTRARSTRPCSSTAWQASCAPRSPPCTGPAHSSARWVHGPRSGPSGASTCGAASGAARPCLWTCSSTRCPTCRWNARISIASCAACMPNCATSKTTATHWHWWPSASPRAFA